MDKISKKNPARIDRRNFLKRFAMVSIVSLGTATGCTSGSSDTDPVAVYGPAPYSDAEVDNMYYILPDESLSLLYDAQDVSPDSQFCIYFSDPMSESSQNAVILQDSQEQSISLSFEWNEEFTVLTITPETVLQTNTEYTLLVDDTAQDADYNSINPTEDAQAIFQTGAG